ncbi:type II toxin-antitoxin system PemK/MazF family toxin [Pseudomethylobacillus aquaticus]|uniref:Type II toxin-antitoxin system PemK/MazF family toxin n=1 Tax=Pseudomethylobacillus aquaticus TaxID=2676064 RepID=A0A3N0V0E1_9PROT|nr:type II toxin-antitoxin system PemK/MazF family toxin [Pseudomethylobacillus aquaticus]ROH86276.1 type II toxin-antitoxin system PemK/MazF family toxin [Pseudomethylobacillus aquaticus]
MVRRGEVYWVNLDPTIGTEIRKTRPALVVSPDDMNAALPRVIIAPLTSKGQALGCRPELTFDGKQARLLLDQIRAIDKQRLCGKLGEIELSVWHPVLLEMLA